MLEVKPDTSVSGGKEETADHGLLTRLQCEPPLHRQPRSPSGGELSNINEESLGDEKDDGVPEEVTPENDFT